MRASLCILAAVFAVVCTEIIGIRIDTSASEVTACNDSQCNVACTAVLYQGYCKDGECWCWKFGQSATRVEKRVTEIQSSPTGVGECQDTQCDQDCKAINWSGGFCKDGKCWCWKQEEPGRIEKPKSEIETGPQLCEKDHCNLECKVRRYNGGSCKTGECMCRADRLERGSWLPANDLATNYKDKSGNQVEACTEPVECLEACQHHGAVGGFCLQRVCWCSMSYNKKPSSTRRVRPIIELQGNITGNSLDSEDATCDRTVCGRLCRSNNKRTGVCLHGYCWCSDSRRQEPVWQKLSNIPQ